MKTSKENHPFDKLSNPAKRALANAGITNLEELSALSEKEFMALHGIGKSTLIPLKAALEANGLSFR
jgi:DNA repair protein RadC